MGKGDSHHKSRFAGKRRRQRQYKERLKRQAEEVHRERAATHGGAPAQVLRQHQQMKRAVLQMDGYAKCPYCSFQSYFGRLEPGIRSVQCGSCCRHFELEVRGEELKIVPITHDDYAICQYCGKKHDVLHSGGRGVVVVCACGKRFKLGEKQAPPAPPPPSPPPAQHRRPQIRRKPNSPWCTCTCGSAVRVKGSYAIMVPATCHVCRLEFDALPAE
jgi:hypothetical protein